MQNRTREKQIILRFTEEEAEYFKKAKSKTKFTCYSDFVLYLLHNLKIFIIDMKPMLKMGEELSRIGVNINQIAKAVNTSGNVYKNDIEEIKKRLSDIEEIYGKVFKTFSNAQKGKY